MQIPKLRNPGLAGMGVLVVGWFSISGIRYLLDVYYTSYEVGCQVKSLATKARRTTDAGRKIGASAAGREAQNPRYEARNPKQYQRPNAQMFKTKGNQYGEEEYEEKLDRRGPAG